MSETQSSQSTATSETGKTQDKSSAPSAREVRLAKAASGFRDEAINYYGIVSELLALVAELTNLDASLPEQELRQVVARVKSDGMCQLSQSISQLFDFYPHASESTRRLLTLLESEALEKGVSRTDDGYLIPSSDLMLDSVVACIEATKEQPRRLSLG